MRYEIGITLDKQFISKIRKYQRPFHGKKSDWFAIPKRCLYIPALVLYSSSSESSIARAVERMPRFSAPRLECIDGVVSESGSFSLVFEKPDFIEWREKLLEEMEKFYDKSCAPHPKSWEHNHMKPENISAEKLRELAQKYGHPYNAKEIWTPRVVVATIKRKTKQVPVHFSEFFGKSAHSERISVYKHRGQCLPEMIRQYDWK